MVTYVASPCLYFFLKYVYLIDWYKWTEFSISTHGMMLTFGPAITLKYSKMTGGITKLFMFMRL